MGKKQGDERAKVPSVEIFAPIEECAEGSFFTEVFIKPAEDEKPCYKARLIWCCPKDAYNPETGKCTDKKTIHKLIREEALPDECATSISPSEVNERLARLEEKLNEFIEKLPATAPSNPKRQRKKYNCKELLEKSPCAIDLGAKKAWAGCFAQRERKEHGKSLREGMREGWKKVKSCSEPES